MGQITANEAEAFSRQFNEVLGEIGRVVRGKENHIAMALVCLFAEGHLLIEDVPGTGKTVLAKSMANVLDGSWSRIQFTPDLLPADVTGGLVYSQKNGEFELRKGPIFANIVLADEINRASPKTQSALLEVMEERQVTIGNATNPVPRPFIVIATQNPVEQAGTYRLPEAQLDRFLMRLSLGYPEFTAETSVLENAASGIDSSTVDQVLSTKAVASMVELAAQVPVAKEINEYIVRLCAASRVLSQVRLGVSTRGAVAMMRAVRALAISQGRDFVNADDVKTVALSVMSHRLLLTPESELKRVSSDDLVYELLEMVEAPTAVRV